MQPHYLSHIFSDSLIFSQITEYLTKRELLSLTLINKQFKNIINAHCQYLLREMNLSLSSNKSSLHQMQFYFNRCLRIIRENGMMKEGDAKDRKYSAEDANTNSAMQIVTVDHPFKFQVISSFEVGNVYSGYLTKENKLRIFRTCSLVNCEKENENFYGLYQTMNGVKNVVCKGERLLVTKLTGEVCQISCIKQDPQSIISCSDVIPWTQRIAIHKIQNSYNFSIFIPEQKVSKNTYLREIFGIQSSQKEELEREAEEVIYLPVRNNLNEKYFLVCLPCEFVKQCTVGNKFAYFITQKYELLSADFDFLDDNDCIEVKANVFKPLEGKTIVKVSNGYNFYLALERNLEDLEDWTNERVLMWLRQIGFEAFVKIAKVEKLDGKKLKNIQRKYMVDVLGITKQNMQQKFIMSIEENLKKKSRNEQLYGWGKNQSGQLGSTSANFIGNPQKIKINFLKETEYIDSIFCGWFQTFIRTQKGRIYCTHLKNERRKRRADKEKQQKKQEQQKEEQRMPSNKVFDDEEDEWMKYSKRKNSGKIGSNKNTKKKKGHEHKTLTTVQKGHKKFEEEESWYESNLGKAFFVQSYKNSTFFIQCPNQHKEETGKVKKLRTAKAILDKIMWSDVKKDEFKVGYMDKEMGLIEASAYEMEMFDVKENRIKYFKRNDVIIWDRENKIDIL